MYVNDCYQNYTENMRRLSFVQGLLSSSFSSHGCKMVVEPLDMMPTFKARRLLGRGKATQAEFPSFI